MTIHTPPTSSASGRALRVAASRDLGPLFTRNPHRMIGQDGAFSIPLSLGRTLWFFGDTLVGERIANESLWYPGGQPVGHADMTGRGSIQRMINNTGLVLHHRAGADDLTDFRYLCDEHDQLRALIPLEGDEHPDWDRIWCQHGIAIESKVYLSFIKVRMLDTPGPLPVNFEIVGSGLAVGDDRLESWRRITRGGDSILWSADQPHFATAFLLGGDGWLYLYGTVKRASDGRQLCYLARTRPEGIERIDRYEYLVSPEPTWSRDLRQAIPIFDGMPSELSVSFNPQLGGYLAVHSLDLTGKIVGRTAPRPWGPWTEPAVLWTVALPPRPRELPYPPLIYAGKEHPELAGENGRKIYLTYIEFEEYFPHLVEVTLE